MSLTLIIIILTGLISYNCFQDRGRFQALLHSPYQEKREKEYYRFLTSGFVHGSMLHLIVNMYVLYSFGQIVENSFLNMFGEMMGRLNFLFVYLLTIIFANIPTFIKHRNNASFSSVGASGAVSGLLFIFVLLAPWAEGMRLFFAIPIYPIVFGVLYLAYSSWASKNSNDRIDHDAHFAGAIFGMIFALILKPELFNHFIHQLTTTAPF